VEVVSRINIFNAVTDLVNNATLDTRPDIVFMQAPDIGLLVASGYLEPLTPIIDQDIKDRFVDVALSAFRLDGEIYGVGYSVDSYGLIYNKDIISESELPETWDDFFALAVEKTVFDGATPIIHGALLNARDMWFNYPIIRNYGGYYYGLYPNGEYNPYDVGLDQPGMLDYVAKMQEAMTEGIVLTNRIHGESEIVSRFANGKVGMMIYGLWYASILQERGINYGRASLPDHDDGTTSRALTTVQGFVLNRFSLQQDQSIDFLKYILEDANQQRLIEAGNDYDRKLGTRNPANITVSQSDYIQSSEILASLSALNDETEPFPNLPEGPIWYNYTSTVFQAIFFPLTEAVDPEAKLGELADKIRDDVRLMNLQAQRIEIPSYIYMIIIALILIGLFIYIIHCRIKNKKCPIYLQKPRWKQTLLAWGLILPMIILLLVFYVYPIFHNMYLSLTDYSGINLREYGLIGFANYRNIFVKGFQGLVSMSLWTLSFATCVVVVSFISGVLIAFMLKQTHVKIAKIYRIIFILPWVIPTVITLLMWQGLLETENGLINQILSLIGIPNIPWLSHPWIAKLSTIMVMTWFSFPYFMVIASGLIQAIPKDYYDAAKVDGANAFYTFFSITLPLVFRAMIPTLIMSFIMQFNQFGVYILTGGGPAADKIGDPGATDLLITYVFNTAFNTNRYAVAAAYSVLIFVFIAIFAILSMRITRKVADNG
jgi:arabinogalactan oligomer/maltooligosaccharide transport system permease protein